MLQLSRNIALLRVQKYAPRPTWQGPAGLEPTNNRVLARVGLVGLCGICYWSPHCVGLQGFLLFFLSDYCLHRGSTRPSLTPYWTGVLLLLLFSTARPRMCVSRGGTRWCCIMLTDGALMKTSVQSLSPCRVTTAAPLPRNKLVELCGAHATC
jgi:hypothetical protein